MSIREESQDGYCVQIGINLTHKRTAVVVVIGVVEPAYIFMNWIMTIHHHHHDVFFVCFLGKTAIT